VAKDERTSLSPPRRMSIVELAGYNNLMNIVLAKRVKMKITEIIHSGESFSYIFLL
jgi:hypothetical protein